MRGRPGDAVKLFMRTVGVPAFGLLMMRVIPVWKKLCAVAHTLPNDYAIVLEHQQGEPLPAGYLSDVTDPGPGDRGWQEPGVHEERPGRSRCRAARGNARGSCPAKRTWCAGKATVPVLREFFGS